MRKILFLTPLLALGACDTLNSMGLGGESATPAPLNREYSRQQARGKITGEDGFSLGGGSEDKSSGARLGVNSFLWRATLDTLSFMPFASADPFGGVIITDWYEDPKTPGERYKVNAVILDSTLRADAIKVKLFKQKREKNNEWRDIDVHPKLSRKLEDTVLTRARELRVTAAAREAE